MLLWVDELYPITSNKKPPKRRTFWSRKLMRTFSPKLLPTATLMMIMLWSCTQERLGNPFDIQLEKRLTRLSPTSSLEYFMLPDERDYNAIPQGKNNPLSYEKVELGKLLFFETGIAREAMDDSGSGTYSCATCHVPTAGFMPGRVQGIADGGAGFGLNGEGRDISTQYVEGILDVQGARALSLLNVAYVTNTTWNGKFGANYVNVGTESVWGIDDESTEVNRLGLDGLETQNLEGLDLHRMIIDEYVLDTLGYRPYYNAAFADVPEEERYGKITTSFAISAYIRTLLPNQAPFQKWLQGDKGAMTDAEKRGANIFYDKAGCYRCHKGPSMSSVEFHALGVNDLYQTGEAYQTDENDKRNLGRGGFTNLAKDMYKFKVPTIYNMGDSPFYFHGSSKRSLSDLVEYFDLGVKENPNVPDSQISPFFHPLMLTQKEKDDLLAFLENGLRDPDLMRYVPEEVLSGNCFPNNDIQSQIELGCN